MEVYFTRLNWNDTSFPIAASETGLCYVGALNEPSDLFDDWIRKHLPRAELIEHPRIMQPYQEQLLEYLNGVRTRFSLPLHLIGTPFQLEVWQALCHVPYGVTVTYSDIAKQIYRPGATRAVGTAISKNRVLIVVPCHRIVGKKGDLTGYWGGLNMKRQLLEIEQVSSSKLPFL